MDYNRDFGLRVCTPFCCITGSASQESCPYALGAVDAGYWLLCLTPVALQSEQCKRRKREEGAVSGRTSPQPSALTLSYHGIAQY